MWIKLAVLGSILTILSGCATTPGGAAPSAPLDARQTLSISVIDSSGAPVQAECVLSNDKGSWKTTAPNSVEVERSSKNLNVECKSPRLIDGSLTAVPRLPGERLRSTTGQATQSNAGAGYNYPDKLRVIMGRGYTVDRWDQDYAERRAKCQPGQSC